MTGFAVSALSLFTPVGRRKYLSGDERLRFQGQAKQQEQLVRLFCMLLLFTGCRVSEALELTPARLDAGELSVVLRTLKQRQLIYRAVPIPDWLVRDLVALTWCAERDAPIWSWSRQKAWEVVKKMMIAAGINGPQACPRGLRHSYGVTLAQQNVPLSSIQKWMGHSSLETTAIYLQVVGAEEREFAERLWRAYAAE